MSLIAVKGVSRVFRHRKASALFRDHLRNMVNQLFGEGFYGLRIVSFRVSAREAVVLVGANGAGRSTRLAPVCGPAEPDGGTVEVEGSIARLLELGSGFHPDLAGRENLKMNAARLGMTERQTDERFDETLE